MVITKKLAEKIADDLLKHIATLPEGSEICTYQAFVDVFGENSVANFEIIIEGEKYDIFALFDVDREVRKIAKNMVLNWIAQCTMIW